MKLQIELNNATCSFCSDFKALCWRRVGLILPGKFYFSFFNSSGVLGSSLGDNITVLLLSLAMVCIFELLKL